MQRHTLTEATALARVFGFDAISALSPEALDRLAADVRDVVREDGQEGGWSDVNESEAFYPAARLLCTRLGGVGNLNSYIRCLMAGKDN